MVSGSISLPLSGFFSPFPHGTGTLSVSWEYLALPDGPGRFAQNSTCSALLRILLCQSPLRLRGCHPLWPFFPKRSARINCTISQSYYPSGALLRRWFGLFPGRSPLLGESLLFSVSSLKFIRVTVLLTAGLSHSEIFGSKIICIYPKLIAAYHVLHRLHEPRHPPCAL